MWIFGASARRDSSLRRARRGWKKPTIEALRARLTQLEAPEQMRAGRYEESGAMAELDDAKGAADAADEHAALAEARQPVGVARLAQPEPGSIRRPS